MTSYLFSLVAASLAAAVIGILSPSGERNTLTQHVRLITVLVLIVLLVSPLHGAIRSVRDFLNGEITLPGLDAPTEDSYREQMEEALGNASTEYFTQALTRMLEGEFEIKTGEVRCRVDWQTDEGRLTPKRVTVILSGRAIWKDAGAIERFVSELLGCECSSAIE